MIYCTVCYCLTYLIMIIWFTNEIHMQLGSWIVYQLRTISLKYITAIVKYSKNY
jgi:branched-subunit amino acid transport protein